MIVAAHQTMLAPPALPYDAEVEYLESTRTQYVDTGVAPKNVPGFAMSLDCMRISGAWSGYGTGVFPGQRIVLRNYTGGTALQVGSDVYGNGSVLNGIRITVSFDMVNGSVSVGEYSDTFDPSTYTNLGGGYNFYLFAVSRNNTPNPNPYDNIRIYGAKFWSNGVLVRDFIPVRVGQTGYLFDRASGTLFGNAGTGNFTIGPDK